MASLTTPAILLRRIAFGDHDLIVTLFTRLQGKTSAIAKSAKKSVKRFSGVLEPFSRLNVVLAQGRGSGMPVLQEASLADPFFKIREEILKTAYASYWAELIDLWLAEGEPQETLYGLTLHVLAELNRGETPAEVLSILFQMRFLSLAGLRPNFENCHACKTALDQIRHASVISDLGSGGIACPTCGSPTASRLPIAKGTLKQLRWTDSGDLAQAARIRFTPTAIAEGLAFLEAFLPFHIGKSPRSLKVLRAVRQSINDGKNHDTPCR